MKATKKYLKYAIGEVILVVVGILIAVSLNNWNNSRIKHNQLLEIGRQIVNDLETDTLTIHSITRYYEAMDSLYQRTMGDSVLMEEINENPNFKSLATVIIPFHPKTSGYDLLKVYEFDQETTKDSLIHQTKLLYSQILSVATLTNKLINEDVRSNLSDWKNNKEWYSDFINNRTNDQMTEYFLNDPFYKNKISNYYLLVYENFLPSIKFYQESCTKILEKWKNFLD